MAYSVLGVVGPLRLLRWPCFSGMVDLTCEARLKFAWLASVSGACHVELDKLPKLNNTKSKRSPKRLLVELVFLSFIQIESQKACLVIHFSTNQMQIKSNEKNVGGVS